MEYTQWDGKVVVTKQENKVLILVVMEYTQWGRKIGASGKKFCLNPCCNGIYSMRENKFNLVLSNLVLILVVMEYTQWALIKAGAKSVKGVLILVVMEYTQWDHNRN